ncbi:hypothetical protein Acr_25g0005500 [Actinidia rufa]|uniref:Uncharacterized protein n=1 Tax=Actinidia rufa TaxID=165716 RepID=A0A7J0GZE2_9ERIC|nr:hypothetical protein Acr_25g0005500 [Actinidia rufa]
MAGRNRLPRQPEDFRGFRDGPRPVMHRGPGPFPLPPAALEEELELQYRDMQRILAENRHMIDENVIMQRELAAAKDEIHRLGQIIPNLRADREVQARELIERGLKLEAELRTVEPLRTEVIQLRAEAQKLNALRQDMSSQVQTLTMNSTENLKADIEKGTFRSQVYIMNAECKILLGEEPGWSPWLVKLKSYEQRNSVWIEELADLAVPMVTSMVVELGARTISVDLPDVEKGSEFVLLRNCSREFTLACGSYAVVGGYCPWLFTTLGYAVMNESCPWPLSCTRLPVDVLQTNHLVLVDIVVSTSLLGGSNR